MPCDICNDLLLRSETHFHKITTANGPTKVDEHLPLTALSEAARRGCRRCAIIDESVNKWKTIDNFDNFVIELKSGGRNDPAHLVKDIDPGLHVSVTHKDSWERKESQGFYFWIRKDFLIYSNLDVAFTLYTDCELSSRQLEIPLLVTVPPAPSERDYARQARQWLDYCIKNHSHRCQPTIQRLPTRVIDVGDFSQMPRLVEVDSGQIGHYAALSYCWGLSRTFTTTMETFEQRTRGFTLEDLPATIRDAVLLARKMSIPYVWADSLCIIQDSSADWNKEAARMCDVYANATITFAAIDCPESETGLFVATGRRLIQLGKLEERIFARKHYHGEVGRMHQDLPESATKLKGNVLLSRGWCLQEIMLSSRLLWMKGTEMCWSCLCTTACECQPTPHTELISKRGSRMEHSLGGLLNLEHELLTSPHKINWWIRRWFDLVETYTSRSLTQISDRLPAIAGLAAWIQKFIREKYLFGLWETDEFLDQLLWFITGNLNYTKYYRAPQGQLELDYAPSWSWTSTWGQVGMPWTTFESPRSSNVTPGTPPETSPGTPLGTPPGTPGSPESSTSIDSYLNHRAFNRKRYGKNLNPAFSVWKLENVSSKLTSTNAFGCGNGTVTLFSLLTPLKCYVGPTPKTYHTLSHSFIFPGTLGTNDTAAPVVLFSPAEYRDKWSPDNRYDHVDSPEWYAEKDIYFIFAQLGVLKKSENVIDFCGLLLEFVGSEPRSEGGGGLRKFRRLGYAESIFNTAHEEVDVDSRRESWQFWQNSGDWQTINLI